MQASKGISYPLGEVEGSDPQGPEAAQHGEKGQAQVVPGGKHQEMILAFAVAGGVTLKNQMDSTYAHLPCRLSQPPSSQLLLSSGPITYSHTFPTYEFKEWLSKIF